MKNKLYIPRRKNSLYNHHFHHLLRWRDRQRERERDYVARYIDDERDKTVWVCVWERERERERRRRAMRIAVEDRFRFPFSAATSSTLARPERIWAKCSRRGAVQASCYRRVSALSRSIDHITRPISIDLVMSWTLFWAGWVVIVCSIVWMSVMCVKSVCACELAP